MAKQTRGCFNFPGPFCRDVVLAGAVLTGYCILLFDNSQSLLTFYSHMLIGKVWIYRLLFCNFVCVFVRLQISPRRIKLAASYFVWRFIHVLGSESPILGKIFPQKPKIGRISQYRQMGNWAYLLELHTFFFYAFLLMGAKFPCKELILLSTSFLGTHDPRTRAVPHGQAKGCNGKRPAWGRYYSPPPPCAKDQNRFSNTVNSVTDE